MLVTQQGSDENAGFEVFRRRIAVNCQAGIADNVTPMNCQAPQNPGNSAPAMEGPFPQAAPAIPPPGVAELLGAGLQDHQAGRLADAEAHYRRILDIVPGHADALHLLGGLAYQTGRLEAAIELIGRAIEHNGNDPSYHSSLGLVLHTINRLDEAVASYDRALLLNPDYAIALLNRGLALEALQRFDEALESYDRALAIEPNFAGAWLNRGNSLQQLGRLAEALESYDRALAVRPDLAEAHYSRAEALHSLERPDEALASYDRALALNPDLSRFITGQVSNIAKRPLKRPEKRLEFSVGWLAHNLPAAWSEKEAYYVYVNLENRGDRPWLASHLQAPAITLDVRIQGQIVTKLPLSKDVSPGEHVTFNFWLDLPEGTGDWDLALSLVAQDCIWTGAKETPPLLATIQRVASASPSYRTVTLMRTSNPAFYAPSHSVPRSRSGRPYPLLIRNATGARIYDPENNEWIDYVMGWGSALLGYAHPEISRAIADHLHSGAVLSLPHELEAEVTRRLVELIPCAEMVLFGKNGSDACNAAVRAARLATGRRVVLFSGYHGWHEPFAEVFEPALAPPCGSKEVFRFGLGHLDALRKLVTEHSGTIAAVMLEPAAQVEGVDGPVRDADPDYLRKVTEICHGENAILIFDEIMTGFRFRCGSVQRATGVLPDLACFGKALSSGMPLSVLVGRRDVLAPVLPQMFYHPTFKGEAYSFAAALAALNIYQQEDVPSRIRTFGNHLIDGVNGISEELGIDGQMVGLPYRMVYKFNESQEGRRAYLRTLLQQELLQRRVLTFRGFMLPSLAHGEQELEETLRSFRTALTRVQQVATEESFVSSLEIPLVV
jgi:glutamate-1-semialdehyde aminotransferase/tetratricopeptide (TPR) repeat protein